MTWSLYLKADFVTKFPFNDFSMTRFLPSSFSPHPKVLRYIESNMYIKAISFTKTSALSYFSTTKRDPLHQFCYYHLCSLNLLQSLPQLKEHCFFITCYLRELHGLSLMEETCHNCNKTRGYSL